MATTPLNLYSIFTLMIAVDGMLKSNSPLFSIAK